MICVSDGELDDLTERLEKVRFPDQLELKPEAKWSYGTGAFALASPLRHASYVVYLTLHRAELHEEAHIVLVQ